MYKFPVIANDDRQLSLLSVFVGVCVCTLPVKRVKLKPFYIPIP